MYQAHDPVGASPPLTPCAAHIKGLTQESHPTAPTNLGKDDLLDLEGGLIGTCDGQPVGPVPRPTNLPLGQRMIVEGLMRWKIGQREEEGWSLVQRPNCGKFRYMGLG